MDNQTKAIFYTGSIQENFIGHIMAEIFKDRIYAPFIEGKEDLTILDVGAHIGLFTLYAAPFAKKIYSIEPSLEHFTTLTQNIQSNNLMNVEPFKLAIANKNAMQKFHHNPNKTMYSLRPEVANEALGTEEVEVQTLEKFLDDNDIKQVDFMKLDVEGVEFEILGGTAFKNIAPRIKTIVTESHSWAGRNPNQLVESLRNNGYEVGRMQSDANILVGTR